MSIALLAALFLVVALLFAAAQGRGTPQAPPRPKARQPRVARDIPRDPVVDPDLDPAVEPWAEWPTARRDDGSQR